MTGPGTNNADASSFEVQQVASMSKSLLSPSEKRSFCDIPADRKRALISSCSEALRKLARSAEAIGRADMLPALIEVADGLESMAATIAETEAGAEVLARTARLVRATEGMLASMSSSSNVH
ncbi:hypothetical protein HFN57_15465 [Rhizobium leguminosarum]|nr:hypothetical protein [Rhizobium leguminosarum]